MDVVVDDYLPTSHGRLIFMHSKVPNEFWSALLEKAYAKLHGSYEALRGGTMIEAMVDFSGGIGEIYDHENIPENLFDILHQSYNRRHMLGASMCPDPARSEAKMTCGLIKGHAYSVTKVIKVCQKCRSSHEIAGRTFH